MSNKAIVEIEGFEELQKKIKQLSNPKDKRREVLGILRNVAKSTVNAAKGFAPVSKKAHWQGGKRAKKKIPSGTLKRSIGTITGRNKENPTIFVGPRAKGSYDGYYGNWVEERVNHYRVGFKRNKKGNRAYNDANAISVRVKFTPFMKNAYKQTQGKVTKEAEQKTARFIQRRIDKLSV